MMEMEIRDDSLLITGYVNAVERLSKPIHDKLHGKVQTFIEKIKAGAFKRSLERYSDVVVLLNHDESRKLASAKDGTAKLTEDSIGLKAQVEIRDSEVIQKARDGKLTGWSFGFFINDDEVKEINGVSVRTVNDLDLMEVSILDDRKKPAYVGTLIEARAENQLEIRDGDMAIEENINEESIKNEKLTIRENEEFTLNEIANAIADVIIKKLEDSKRSEESKNDISEEMQEHEERNEVIDYSSYIDRLKKLEKEKNDES